VLVDLVVNHTSNEHPWFQEARRDKGSKFRNYYVWTQESPEDGGQHAVFGEQQGGNWAFDEEAGAYYYHTFYKHQPDLNLTNPEVHEEIRKTMRFWLRLGVAGFRMDAVPHMIRQKGHEHFRGDPHDLFRDFRRFVEEQRQDAVLLAEVDVEPERYKAFFGDEDQLHMLLNFYLDNYLFLAFADGQAAPIAHALETLPQTSTSEQYANFLRNHDELDLERLTEGERGRVYEAFAPEETMRIFGRGVHRRLAPMLGGDRRRLELAYSLLFSLPGTPVLRYGQEIGMGENLSLEGRSSVRTPMQWSDEPNGGFSSASSAELVRPVIRGGDFGYERVNVNEQRLDPDSFLNWLGRAIRTRKECPELGWGKPEVIATGDPHIFAHLCRWKGSVVLAIYNFSPEERTATLKLEAEDADHLIDIFGDCHYEAFDRSSCRVHLKGFGYRWLRKSALHPTTSGEEGHQ
jgi:maltose alpha-D-glucosyltransferase/alpha-amylase